MNIKNKDKLEVRTRWSEIKSSQNWYTNIIFNKDYKYINFIKFRSADAAVVNTNYFSEKKLHKLLKIFYIYVNIWNVQIVLKIIIFCIKNIKNSKITIYILFKNIYFINNLCNFRIEGKSIQNRHFGKITKKFWDRGSNRQKNVKNLRAATNFPTFTSPKNWGNL